MSLETMTKLSSVTVGAGGSSSISFTNIPQGYTDLKVVMSLRSSAGSLTGGFADSSWVSVNGSSSTNGSFRHIWGQGSGANTNSGSLTYIAPINGSGSSASAFSNVELNVKNYSANRLKSYSVDSASENASASANFLSLIAGVWTNSSPITSLVLYCGEGNFVQHSTAVLYGIKNARQTAGNSVKAAGGNVIFDGTYVYHVFTSSGTFAPNQGFLADYVVIAGGGAGSPSRSGGGGAGGLLSSIEATGGGGTLQPEVSFAPATYTVTVGAGGATVLDANPYSGSNSAITGFTTSIIAIGGGGGGNSGAGGGATGAARSGGSGGGGLQGPTAGGAGTANQGYRGGNGAGGSVLGGAGGGGTGGGGGSGGSGAGVSGTTNTGGGGGGGGDGNSNGGNGGSGLVIIRYAI